MEVEKNLNPRPIFQNQPILCPWVTCQPYPSTQEIKNKLNEFVKNYGSAVNNSSSKKTSSSDAVTFNPYTPPGQQSSSTHFFYFLRLMQLFPDTHPATLHTVLTLSKNNFFYAIDKLLYAKKCKNNLSKRTTYPFKSGRGRGAYASTRGRQSYNRPIPTYQPVSRTISDDLAEVQRIIGLAEKPYTEVQSVLTENNGENIDQEQDVTNDAQQVMNICIENNEQIVQDPRQTFVDAENQEVIEIVCFDNEQAVMEEQKIDDAMDIETFGEHSVETDVQIEPSYEKEGESEPAVIVVDTINDLDGSEIIEEGHLIEPHESNQLDSADY